MSYSKKGVFTTARRRTLEACKKASEITLPSFSTAQESNDFCRSLFPIKAELSKFHATCKEYHEGWQAHIQNMKDTNDSHLQKEQEAFDTVFADLNEGTKVVFDSIKSANDHLDAILQQACDATGQLGRNESSSSTTDSTHVQPSAPIEDDNASVIAHHDSTATTESSNANLISVPASSVPTSSVPTTAIVTSTATMPTPGMGVTASASTVQPSFPPGYPAPVLPSAPAQNFFPNMPQFNAYQPTNPLANAVSTMPQMNFPTGFSAFSGSTQPIASLYPQIPSTIPPMPIPGANPSMPQAAAIASQPPTSHPPVMPSQLIQPSASGYQQLQMYNLPKMNFPIFDGNPREFNYWWNTFGVVHNNPSITPLEKLVLLNSLLRGKAKEAVSYFDANHANYDLVVNEIYQRFGRPDLIFQSLYAEFANIQVKGHHINDIAKAVYAMESIFKQLETNGLDINNDNTWKLLYREKIPLRIFQKVNLYGIDPPFADLRQRVLLVIRSETECPNAHQQNNNYQNVQPRADPPLAPLHHAPRQQPKPSTASDSRRPRDDKSRTKSKKCIFCHNHQNPSSCRTVTEIRERRRIASERKLCFKCLENHLQSPCKEAKPCIHCSEMHHDALCFKNPDLKNKLQIHAVKIQPSKKREVSMMVVQAPVASSNAKKKIFDANLFLDCGAASSFIHADVARRLNLPVIEEELLDLQRFGDDGKKTSLQVTSKKVSLIIKAQNNIDVPITAYTIKNLTNVLPSVDPETKLKKWVKPDLLIGNDFFWDFFDSEKTEDGFKIVESLLGKIVCGTGIPIYSIMPNSEVVPPSTNDIVEKFFQVEQAGSDESPYTNEEDFAVEKFIEETEIVNGRIQCRLPFTVSDPPLAPLRNMSLKCLESQLKKLAKRPELLHDYNKIICQQLADNINEPAPKNPTSTKQVYLPHHAIETPHKSTKVRIVFNSSAKASKNAKSLNDCLYPGPSLIPEIPGILLRIRLMKILVSADIEKAFLQLALHPEDRDYARFFWIKSVEDYLERGFRMDNVMELRFCTIFFGGKCSPFQLMAAIRKLLLQLQDQVLAGQIKRNMYVDNSFIGGSKAEEVIQKAETAIQLFKTVQMNLRDVMSNDPKVNKYFNVQPSLLSVLGLQWNPVADTLTIKMPSKAVDIQQITKRDVLAEIASKYDPLGILAPVMVRFKLFMQELWKKNTSWDDKLSPEEIVKWKLLIEEPMAASIDRFLKPPEGECFFELHVFADASAKAYAAVAYIVIKNRSGEAKNYLIMSKSKICPTKPITIPRLELLALTLGVKLCKYVEANVDIEWNNVVLWTDSSAVFYWLRSNKPLKRFVENRVKIIKAGEAEIRHVPTKENPADIASRGMSATSLKDSSLWWHGPAFLKNDASKWPNLTVSDTPEKLPEVQKEFIFAVIPIIKDRKDKFITIKSGSTWNRLVRVTCYCMYFVNKCKKLQCPDPRSTEAFKTAEQILIKDIQQSNYPDESTCRSLRIFKDENAMLRCRTRLENNSDLDLAAPLFLPNSEESNLLILKIHYDSKHAGARHVLTELRQTFWLSRGLTTVKKAIKACRPCLKFKSKPYLLPEMPSLPKSRVNQYLPFQHIGVDCAGPFTIKNNSEIEKIWVVLFTCLTTRAVFLDTVKEMSAAAFINTLRRFVSNCGTPSSILSDNGTNFKAAGTHFIPLWHTVTPDPEFFDYITSKKIQWNYITERAPWKGGIYERLIGSVKSSLKHGIGRKRLTEEDFKTLIVEVQGILNSRPLTDTEGEIKAIRPIDFILPNAYLGTPRFSDRNDEAFDPSYLPKENFKDKLLKNLHKSMECIDKTWKRWNKEYLTKLRETSQFLHKQKGLEMIPEVDEIVLIEEDEVPRGSWRMGKVVEVKESRDGQVRSVIVQTANGNLLNRSPAHLYPLEANLDPESRKASAPTTKKLNSIVPQTNNVQQENTVQQPPPISENRRVTRSMKSTVNSLFFFLTLCQLFLLSSASVPVVTEAYCKNGYIMAKTFNVSKISIHLPHHSKLVKVNDSISLIPLPHEFLTSYSVFETMFWSNSGDSVTLNLECEIVDFCQLITCIFCQDHITHPHCWEWSTWLMLSAICLALIACCVRKCNFTQAPLFVKGGRWIIQSSFNKNVVKADQLHLCCSGNVKSVHKTETNIEEARESKDDSANVKLPLSIVQQNVLLFAIIMLCLFSFAETCSDASVLQAKGESCFMLNENKISCNFSTKNWMSVSSGKEACLLLQSDEKIPVGTVKISAKAFAACNKFELGHTKFMKINVKSAKRCPGMGSCTNNNCAEVQPYSHIEELGVANDHPGITECVESCGSITCGCALFGTGCTFYRYFAEALNEEYYEIFDCENWNAFYNITVAVDSHNSTFSRTVTLKPGQTAHLEDINISIRKAATEFLQEFPSDSVFLEKGNEVAWLSKGAAEETKLFMCQHGSKCKLKHDACNCQAADSTVHCSCDDQEELKDQWIQNKLPSLVGQHLFLPSPTGPIANVAADIDIVVETFNLSASTLIHYTDCSITNVTVSGTNGPEGALLKTYCSTKFGNSIGHVYCPTQTFDVKCSKNGTWSERRWYTNDVTVDEDCILVCQVSQHNFRIKGHLNQKKDSEDWNRIHGIGADNTSTIKAIGIGLLNMFQHFYDYVLFIVAGIAVIFVAVLLLK